MQFAVAITALIATNAVAAQNAVDAQEAATPSVRAAAVEVDLDAQQLTQEDLSQRTDTELTALTAQWSQLSPQQRRHLLAEVRGRMVNNRQMRRPQGVIVQRQYGRVVRKSDGSVVLQTRVVQISPRHHADNAETAAPRVTFGIGFERRTREPESVTHNPPQADVTQPAVTISQDSPPSSNR